MGFGQRLKEKRKALGLTQEQLAKELNVSRSAISNWEIERNYPDIETLMRLAEKFQMPIGDLFVEGQQEAEEELVSTSKPQRRKILFGSLLSIAILALFFFLIQPKTPTIEWVEEESPEYAERMAFEKQEIQSVTLEGQQLQVLFTVPQKAAGYQIESDGDEVWVSLYRFKEGAAPIQDAVLPYQGLMTFDLGEQSQPKTIKVHYSKGL